MNLWSQLNQLNYALFICFLKMTGEVAFISQIFSSAVGDRRQEIMGPVCKGLRV
jgi:hypothetical protein